MGLPIERENFDEQEYRRFAERLTESLTVLRELLARPGFGVGPKSIGARDPRLTLEINRFNLEANTPPMTLAGRPFSQLQRELTQALSVVRDAADKHGARAALVGILPTLRVAHLSEGVLSDSARYRALSSRLRNMRGEPFAVHIKGRESLSAHCDDVALEGANASFQVHLRVAPEDFATCYNAAQLAAAPVLAACANSPYFDGRSLWEETRIALFQQSVDTRLDARERTRTPSSVSFGYGWIHQPYEPFAENVALHPALLPLLAEEDPQRALARGLVPQLSELRLHHGTVWNWNRAVFDPADGGHLRIEHRLLPSGPTVIDMVANAALTIGLTLGLSTQMARLSPTFPFSYVQQNMYEAAKHGLSAELVWPAQQAPSPCPRSARELVLSLLPTAEAGLIAAGVEPQEVRGLLEIIRARGPRAARAQSYSASWWNRTPSLGASARWLRWWRPTLLGPRATCPCTAGASRTRDLRGVRRPKVHHRVRAPRLPVLCARLGRFGGAHAERFLHPQITRGKRVGPA
jgi:gamma-glutamyl:cysteine ligase YbdK (ATP-grasp superfamily)